MPRIIQPTLIRTSALISANAGGATIELDFDFGNLEGALLLGVEYGGAFADDTTGVYELALHFQGTAAAPAASLDLLGNEQTFAYRNINLLDITGVGNVNIPYPAVDLSRLNIQILSNIAHQSFNSGGVARTSRARVYYKRLLFTQSELGAQLAVRR